MIFRLAREARVCPIWKGAVCNDSLSLSPGLLYWWCWPWWCWPWWCWTYWCWPYWCWPWLLMLTMVMLTILMLADIRFMNSHSFHTHLSKSFSLSSYDRQIILFVFPAMAEDLVRGRLLQIQSCQDSSVNKQSIISNDLPQHLSWVHQKSALCAKKYHWLHSGFSKTDSLMF